MERKIQTILCSIFFMLSAVAQAEPRYDLIQIDPDAWGTNSSGPVPDTVALAINNRGTVLGIYRATNEWLKKPFLWRDGKVTTLQEEYRSFPVAINNRDEVVGWLFVPGETQLRSLAWLNSGGTNFILGPTNHFEEGWSSHALGINDDGVVVGEIAGDGFVFRPGEVRFPDLGAGPCWTGLSRLSLINNSGLVIGETDRVPYIWPSFLRPELNEYLGEITPAVLNQSNMIAGLEGLRPVLWDGTNRVYLSTPGERGQIMAMNDRGTVIGRTVQWSGAVNDGFPGWREGEAVIWNGATGLALSTLVSVPEGAKLAPYGINNEGTIAATLELGDSRQAVMLKMRAGKRLPSIAITVPSEKKLVTTSLIEARATVRSESEVRGVTYTLYSRYAIPSSGFPPCWWTGPSTDSFPVATNVVSEAPFTTTFTNVMPGQYAWEALTEDMEGVRAFSHRAYVVVSAPPALRIRESWRDEIDVAVDGTGGYLHRLEVSSNLVDWVEFTNFSPSVGLLISEGSGIRTNVTRRFFRAKVVAEDKESFGEAPVFAPEPQPPDFLADRTLILDFGGGGYSVYFSSEDKGILDFGEEEIRYEWRPESRRVRIWASWGEDEINLRPGTWWEYSGSFSSKYTAPGKEPVRYDGNFRLSFSPGWAPSRR